MMRVIVLAPISNSLYSRAVTHLLAQQKDVRVAGIMVRTPWNLPRVRSELRRDGARLVKKVFNKWFLAEKRFSVTSEETLLSLTQHIQLPGNSLHDLARHWDIPIITVKDHNDQSSQTFLKKAAPDVIVFTGGGLIRENILRIPKLGFLNCHTGILPHYRGMDVIEWAVLKACKKLPEVGITLHFIDKGVDTGPILLRRKVELKKGDTFELIRQRMEPLMVRLILEGVCGLRDGKLKPIAQKPEVGRQYYVMHPRITGYASNKLDTLI